MRLVIHVGRAAAVFWVAAILLPAATLQAQTVPQHDSPQTALHGISSTSDTVLDHVGGLTGDVRAAEDDVLRVVARLRLEAERFIARLP